MANIGEPLRRITVIPLTEPVRGPEPERKVPRPTEPAEPAKEPEKVDV